MDIMEVDQLMIKRSRPNLGKYKCSIKVVEIGMIFEGKHNEKVKLYDDHNVSFHQKNCCLPPFETVGENGISSSTLKKSDFM